MRLKVYKESSFKCTLRANESKKLHLFNDSDFSGLVPGEFFVAVSCRAIAQNKQQFEHENVFFPAPLKSSPLEKAAVKTAVSEQNGSFVIHISADKPAFFAVLETPGIPGIFSDNSFLLLPGQEKKLTFTPKVKTTLKELQKVLEVTTLRDTYQ